MIQGLDDFGRQVMYTCYGGPSAPREPGDMYFQLPGKEEELAASKKFWAVHALAK